MALDILIGDDSPNQRKPDPKGPRPFLGVKFICANEAYNRFYKSTDETSYVGRCPKCMKEVRIGIGSHGTSSRFFTYDCRG